MLYKDRKLKKGFTLIEALLTIIIISIVVLMAIPSLNSTGARVRTVSRQIIDDMRYARTKAVTDGKNIIVDFTNPTKYVIMYDDGTKIKEYNYPHQIECKATPTTFTYQKIGSASSNGNLIVSKDEYTMTVNVIGSTGMVHLSGS